MEVCACLARTCARHQRAAWTRTAAARRRWRRTCSGATRPPSRASAPTTRAASASSLDPTSPRCARLHSPAVPGRRLSCSKHSGFAAVPTGFPAKRHSHARPAQVLTVGFWVAQTPAPTGMCIWRFGRLPLPTRAVGRHALRRMLRCPSQWSTTPTQCTCSVVDIGHLPALKVIHSLRRAGVPGRERAAPDHTLARGPRRALRPRGPPRHEPGVRDRPRDPRGAPRHRVLRARLPPVPGARRSLALYDELGPPDKHTSSCKTHLWNKLHRHSFMSSG